MLSLVRASRSLYRHSGGALSAMAVRGRGFSSGEARSAPIEKVTVIGSGLMGSGIAQVSQHLGGVAEVPQLGGAKLGCTVQLFQLMLPIH